MKLLFVLAPPQLQDKDTQWIYGRWGEHLDAPLGEAKQFYSMRGSLAACIEDIEEVLKREEGADPK